MLTEYVCGAIEKAEYKKLENGTWFGEIPGFDGVWANGKSLEGCRSELIEVLEEWLIFKIRDKDFLPVINGISLNIKEKSSI
ncbi:MAG TPA: type II toxin-antitoxin system HicB family antitoxin [Spirochaetes bacterium]|nr:type II toxin-antitoxin system HicB family antitoxin [Spirochaetota bacterium]